MTVKWCKEDRAAWNASEVAQELEKRILSNIATLDNILKNSNLGDSGRGVEEFAKNVDDLSESLDNANTKIEQLNGSDDGVVEYEEGLEDPTVENYVDDHDDDDDDASEMEVVARLRELLKEATDNREIELAYKIERTIDEILEEG